MEMAEFGMDVFSPQSDGGKTLLPGNAYRMGLIREESEVSLRLNELTSHCFVPGTTGCGKSATIYRMLERLIDVKIPFLIIGPEKGEYKGRFGALPGVRIFMTNPAICAMLRTNLSGVDPGVHVPEHMDRLIEIFKHLLGNVCRHAGDFQERHQAKLRGKGAESAQQLLSGEG